MLQEQTNSPIRAFDITTGYPSPGMPSNMNMSPNPVLRPSLMEDLGIGPTVSHFDRQSPLESTPGISGDINDRMFRDSTSLEDEDDDSLSDVDSVTTEDDEKPFYGLPTAALPTGLCYDDRMRYHAEVASTSENDLHPEDPRRIYYIFKELSEAGLVADPKHPRPLVPQPLLRIDAREATRSEICLVHSQSHYDFVKSTAGKDHFFLSP